MKIKHSWILLFVFCVALYWPFWSKGYIPAPFDTLVGAYYPWLSYKWGTITGVPVKNALLSDSFSTFYIWKYLAIDQFLQYKLPTWNPYVFNGTPLLATFHSAILFPANILLFLPRPWSWGLYIFSSTLVSAMSMYLFLGRITKNRWSRLLGSIVFAVGGPMTTWTEFGTAVWAMSIWPLLFLIPTLKSKKLYLISFATLVAWVILSGNVQIVTYLFALLPLWIFYLKADKKYLLMIILGIVLTGIQLIPTYNLYKNSIREAENYVATFNYGLTPIKDLVRFWAADFYGNPVTGNHWSSGVSYHEYSGFLGTTTVLIILNFLLFYKKNKIDKFWSLIFVGSLILLVNNPFSRFIFSLPLPLLTYSSASRILFITTFASGILVARGLANLNKVIIAGILLLIITSLMFVAVPDDKKIITIRNIVIPTAMIICGIIFSKSKKTWILVILVSLDLGRYFIKYNPFVPPGYAFPTTPVIEFLQKNLGQYRFIKQKTNLFPLNSWTPYKLRSPEGYDPLHLLSTHQDFHELNNQPRTNKVSRYAELEDINLEIANKMSVKYYVSVDNTYDPILKKIKYAGWEKVFTDKQVSIYKNPNNVSEVNDNQNYLPNEVLWGALITSLALIHSYSYIAFSIKKFLNFRSAIFNRYRSSHN